MVLSAARDNPANFLACAPYHVLMCTETAASQVSSSTDAPQTSDGQTAAHTINSQVIPAHHDDGYRPQVVLTVHLPDSQGASVNTR